LPITSGVYVKYLKFEKERHYILDIDGAYACSEVTLNQQLLSLHPHGYTPLLVDLTNSIIDGIENKLVITTNPLQLATRWYSGCGIYRDVFMWDGGAVRIEPWDMFISNESVVDGVAKQRLKFTVTADVDADVNILFTITEKDGKTVVCDSISASVIKGEKKELEHFVEIKNAAIDDGCKISHLAYVGDVDMGKDCNVGCGAIFVNYNGRVKNRSIVGDECFIGSNCNVIAPVKIDNRSYICAGTTVTEDVKTNDFVIGRVRQQVKENRAEKYLKEKKGE
jgi:acetyltransferase-like isoleucine patch superfamily enzyme